MRSKSGAWSVGERELFAAFTSKLNSCSYCVGTHGAVATTQLGKEVTDAVLSDWQTAPDGLTRARRAARAHQFQRFSRIVGGLVNAITKAGPIPYAPGLWCGARATPSSPGDERRRPARATALEFRA